MNDIYKNIEEYNLNTEKSKYCTSKPYPFLVIDANFASDNTSPFRKNLLEKNLKTDHDN